MCSLHEKATAKDDSFGPEKKPWLVETENGAILDKLRLLELYESGISFFKEHTKHYEAVTIFSV